MIFPGLEVKNRDCPGKSGTDGHLILDECAEFLFVYGNINVCFCTKNT